MRRHGRLVYALSEESDLTPADPVGAVVLALGLVRTMEASGNLVVLKTSSQSRTSRRWSPRADGARPGTHS